MRDHILLCLRFAIAAVFIVSGFEKAASPPENFLYVLQAYQVLPAGLDRLAAQTFPWVELMLGVFLALGLWLRPVLGALAVMSGTLIIIVGQAIVRQLPIDNCGCFGTLIHLPLKGVIFLDMTIFASMVMGLKHLSALERFSLDRYYSSTRL